MKQILFVLLILGFSQAKIVNSVIANVNNEPITQYEFNETLKKFGGNKKNALDTLINDKLIEHQIKILNITAEPFEIEKRISQIAQQNKLSIQNFQKQVAKHMSLGQFRQEIANSIKQEKLFSSIFQNSNQNITLEQAQRFYKQNSHLFSNFTNVNVVRFFSTDYEILDNFARQKTKSTQGIIISNENFNLSAINPKIADILNQIPIKTLTPIFETNGGYEMFVVTNKNGAKIKSFDSVKDQILIELVKKDRQKELISYLDKLKTKATIKFIK